MGYELVFGVGCMEVELFLCVSVEPVVGVDVLAPDVEGVRVFVCGDA